MILLAEAFLEKGTTVLRSNLCIFAKADKKSELRRSPVSGTRTV